MWIYRTPIGTFWIRPQAGGRWVLGIEDEALGSYHSPEAAASDVADRATGWSEWDDSRVMMGWEPSGLAEWSRA